MSKYDFSDEMFNLSLDKDIDIEVDKIFNFYRNHGFPNYNRDDYDIHKELQKLKDFNEKSLFDPETKTIKQNMTGIGVLWTYFPHWIEILCGSDTQTLKEMWDNDEKLKKLIKKTYIWKCKHREPHWTNNRIRQNAKVFLTGQSVSNFRPTVAKYIYNTYGNQGKIFDMSSGFGGRLMGFYASNCKEYVGCEPSTKTYEGLQLLNNDLSGLNKVVTIVKSGSEIKLNGFDEYFDLCFTSPPYFDTEKYSTEETQSYIKYPELERWLDGFLKDTINNCYQYTKPNGYTIINIANTPRYDILEQKTIETALSSGFKHVDTLFMELSSVSKNKGRKTEPIFVFQK